MAQAMCTRSLASLSLARPSLKVQRGSVAQKVAGRRLTVSAVKSESESCEIQRQQECIATSMAASVFAALATAPSASAAQAVAELAADNRPLVLASLMLPAVGWVLFNILKPGLNQLDKMRASKVAIGALGLGALAALTAEDAQAAQEMATLAADNRPLILLFVLGPAVGWVLFNIARPAFNQISKMVNAQPSAPKKGGKAKRGVLGAIGLSSAMALIPENADAAQEMATLAADNRPLILLFVMGPAVGWVLFNIARPAFNQINKMVGASQSSAPSKKKK